LKKNGVQIKVQHILGHQDKLKRILSHPEVLNVSADKLASTAVNLKKASGSLPAYAEATLYINELVTTADYKKHLRQNYLSMDMREYLIKSNSWKINTVDQIWWEVHESALYALTPKKRRFIQKMIHNKLPCNYRENKMYNYKSSLCTTCMSTIETQDHIFQCKGCPAREKLRKAYKLKLGIILANHHSNQACTLIIKHNVNNYLENKKSLGINTLVPDATTTLIKANNEQIQIGWEQWIKGRISINWGTLQNYDIQTTDTGIRYDTSKKWAKELILLSWEFSHDCWLIRNEK
jgi:hypothetical protein